MTRTILAAGWLAALGAVGCGSTPTQATVDAKAVEEDERLQQAEADREAARAKQRGRRAGGEE